MLQTSDAKYDGGHRDHVLTGILGTGSIPGIIYLTEDYFIFANDDRHLSKRWEIIIPLGSVILYWDLEEKMRQKYDSKKILRNCK